MLAKATVCLAAVFAAALSGCGTVVNCINGDHPAAREIYGGVKQDAQNGSRHLVEAFSGPSPNFSQMPKPPNIARDFVAKSYSAGCGVAMLAIDLPITSVTDTLTLPLTVPATLLKKKPNTTRKAKPKRSNKSAPSAPPSPPMPSSTTVRPTIPNW